LSLSDVFAAKAAATVEMYECLSVYHIGWLLGKSVLLCF